MRILHFTTDTGQPGQIPISDRTAQGLIDNFGYAASSFGDDAVKIANTPTSMVGFLLTGVVEAIAEQARMAAVAESTALVSEAEQILDRTTDEQIARGAAALREVKVTQQGHVIGSRYRRGGYEGPRHGETFGRYGIHVHQRSGPEGDNVWWDSRISIWGDKDGDAETLRDTILNLLQADEAEAREGRDLLLAPKACAAHEAHAKEDAERISSLETSLINACMKLGTDLSEAPNPEGMFRYAEGEEGEILMRGEDGLMRRVATVVPAGADVGLHRRIVDLLKADACEGENLMGAPAACRMAWKSLKERDKLIGDLEQRAKAQQDLFETLANVSEAAGPRGDVSLAKHVGAMRAKLDMHEMDGYVRAFYQMAEMIGASGARTVSPREVFEREIEPRLRTLVQFWQSNVGQKDVEGVVRSVADALDIRMAPDERPHEFLRDDLIPAIEVLKSHSDVTAAFDVQERNDFRDVAALEAMKILMQIRLVKGFSAMSEDIASLAFDMADDMVTKRG